jgi:hypothetical protein
LIGVGTDRDDTADSSWQLFTIGVVSLAQSSVPVLLASCRPTGVPRGMTTDPSIPHADPADVAEQHQDAFPSVNDEGVVADDASTIPLEANEADVAEQRIQAPAQIDDDVFDT